MAAHWKYKSGDSGVKPGDEEKFAWVRRLLETQQESDAQDFFHNLKIDMFADEVFVFSPKGDVITLPAGATPIDFAYSIHSGVGNTMVGAKVNGRIVNFDHVLENGDIVEIRTSKNAPGPSRDWLQLAKSGSARTKIKQWLKKERREENVTHGKEMFERELRQAGIAPADIYTDEVLPIILKRLAFPQLDDLFAAIGYGGVTAQRTVNRIKDELQRSVAGEQKTALDKINEQAERRNKRERHAVHGVLVEGLDNCLIKFSRCCTPVPGDDIIGFITRGAGVSIHRKDCENYLVERGGKQRALDPRELGRAHHGRIQHHAPRREHAALRPRHGRGHRAQLPQRQGADAHRPGRGQQPLHREHHRGGAQPVRAAPDHQPAQRRPRGHPRGPCGLGGGQKTGPSNKEL